jgi:hypothetical protein
MTRYTQDPNLQVDILKKAAASGYPNAEWVINSLQKGGYQRQVGYNATLATRIGTEQKQFEGVSEESF